MFIQSTLMLASTAALVRLPALTRLSLRLKSSPPEVLPIIIASTQAFGFVQALTTEASHSRGVWLHLFSIQEKNEFTPDPRQDARFHA